MSQISEKIRRDFGATDRKRDEGLKTPAGIVRVDDIVYGDDPIWQSLDVYRPRKADDTPLPVIISVHGGGWVYGDKQAYQYYCMSLAERGFAVVNFSYRLAPENKFPAPLEDTCAVFAWVLAHAEEYHFDVKNVFAVGDSAGAHTLELFAALCTNREYRDLVGINPPENFVPKAIALNCGVHIVTVSDQPKDKFSTDLMADYLPNKGTEEELRKVNVMEWITEEFPPAFLMTARDDFLKFQVPGIVGAHGTAGEIGHIPVAHSEAVCGCGNIGCSEAVAGGKALAKLQREKYPDTSIGDMFACHSEDAELRDFVDMMAIVVATEVNILDPDYMILGGGVFAMKGFPMDYLTERIEARVRKPLPLEELNLIYAEDEPDKSVVGAAIYARSKMK